MLITSAPQSVHSSLDLRASPSPVRSFRHRLATTRLSCRNRESQAQKLVRQRPVTLGKGEGNFSVLVLTKEGKSLAERQGDHSSQQQFCAGS